MNPFLPMVPTITDTLRRVPDGHPFVTNLKSPLLLGALGLVVFDYEVECANHLFALERQGFCGRGYLARSQVVLL